MAPVAEGGLLDALPASVLRVAGEADEVERVHHRDRVWEFLGGGGLEPGEAIHRNDPDRGDTIEPGRVVDQPTPALPPRAPAVRAPVAAHPHQQRRGPVPERLMRQPAGDGVSPARLRRRTFSTTDPTRPADT